MELSSDAVVIHRDGRFVFANPAAGSLFGLAAPDDLLGKSVTEFVHSSGRAAAADLVRRIARDEPIPLAEHGFVRADGAEFRGEMTGRRVTFEGAPAVQSVVREVAEPKRAEEELAEARFVLRALKHGMTEGIAIKDAVGRYRMINQTGAWLVDKTPNEFLGKDTEPFPADVARKIVADDRRAMETGETLTVEDLHTVDGTALTLRTTKGPFYDDEGRVVGVIGVTHDVTSEKLALRELEKSRNETERRVRDRRADLARANESVRRETAERERAEGALRRSEKRYRHLYNRAPAMLQSCGRDHRLVSVSDHWLEIMGYERDEVIGRHIAEFVTEESKELFRGESLPALLRTGFATDGPRQLVKKNGEVIDTLISTVAEHDDSGEPARFMSVIVDVTERERAAEALRESEARVRGVLENVADGVIAIDEAGNIESVNPAAEVMFGYRADEMIGRNVSELTTAADKHRHDEYLRRFRETGKSAVIGSGTREVAARRKDGSVFEMELSVGEMRSGDRRTFIGAMRDISKRKRAERALHESRTLLDAVVNSAPLILWAVDRVGTVTLSEGRGLEAMGLRSGELVGQPAPDFAADRANIARALAGEEFSEVIEMGDTVFHTFYRPLRNPEGRVEAVMGVDVNITERKRAVDALVATKEEAEFANRAKSEFLANTSHELRTPLNAIIGFADMLVGGYVGKLEAKQAEYVGDIRESGAALLEIINDILDLTKIESGHVQLSEDILKLASTVASAVRLIRSRADAGGLRLSADAPENLPLLRADPRMVKRILLNLLTNAVKFTPPGGEVTVSASVGVDGALRIGVRDTGIGISAEDLPRVIEPFGQVDAALGRRNEGTGIGLSLVRTMSELHGGTVSLDSELGRGTTATVRFPPERVLDALPRQG